MGGGQGREEGLEISLSINSLCLEVCGGDEIVAEEEWGERERERDRWAVSQSC